jgi:hypothetical protein
VEFPTSIRRALFFVLAGFIVLAPAWPHLLKNAPVWVRPWMMYRDIGVGQCAVRMEMTDAAGRSQRLLVRDVWKLLGEEPPKAPPRLRPWEAFDLARRVATNLPPELKLNVTVHEARRSGWELKRDKSVDKSGNAPQGEP